MSFSCKSLVLSAALACSPAACGDDPQSGVAQEGTQTAFVSVDNRYPGVAVMQLWMSRSYDEEWGAELLQGRRIMPGNSFAIRDVPCGIPFDLRLRSSRNVTSEIRSVVFECDEINRVTFSSESN